MVNIFENVLKIRSKGTVRRNISQGTNYSQIQITVLKPVNLSFVHDFLLINFARIFAVDGRDAMAFKTQLDTLLLFPKHVGLAFLHSSLQLLLKSFSKLTGVGNVVSIQPHTFVARSCQLFRTCTW